MISDKEKRKLNRYYFYGLFPVVIIWALISLFSDTMYGVFFLLGYVWPYMYYTPGFEEKATSESYRFSFLGAFFKLQSRLFEFLPESPKFWMKPLLRLIIPLSFAGMISLINPSWTPMWSIIGWGVFEVFILLNLKLNWQLLQS